METKISYGQATKLCGEIQLHIAEFALQWEKYNMSLTPSLYPFVPNEEAMKKASDNYWAARSKMDAIENQIDLEVSTSTEVPVPPSLKVSGDKPKKNIFGFSKKQSDTEE